MTSLLLAFALAAPSSAPASASTPAPAPLSDSEADDQACQQEGKCVFGDETVDGDLPQSDHVAIRGHGGARFPSMVKGRANFLDRLHAQALDI